jgi:hypothetical protein
MPHLSDRSERRACGSVEGTNGGGIGCRPMKKYILPARHEIAGRVAKRWVAWHFQSNFPNARLDFGAVPLFRWPKPDSIRFTEHCG